MQKEEVGRKISLCSDIRKMAANVQGKGRRQIEREDEKRIKREEREKKRKLNEEPKMKRMQERSDKQKKKDEENNRKCRHVQKSTSENAQMRLHSSRNVGYKRKKAPGQLVRVRVGLSAHVVTTKYTCLVSERHTFNMLRGTMIAMTMTMTLSSFVLAAFGLMTTAQSTRMP